MYAVCYASGHIKFTAHLPHNLYLLPIVEGRKKAVKAAIRSAARLAYDNKTWLVPGIPELRDAAGNIDQHKALDVLCRWVNLHRKHWNNRGLTISWPWVTTGYP